MNARNCTCTCYVCTNKQCSYLLPQTQMCLCSLYTQMVESSTACWGQSANLGLKLFRFQKASPTEFSIMHDAVLHID